MTFRPEGERARGFSQNARGGGNAGERNQDRRSAKAGYSGAVVFKMNTIEKNRKENKMSYGKAG
jgi:hypothetical protein